MTTLTIGQVAKRAGVGRETIRFYERRGLIEEPSRRESGYRQYDNTAVARLAFIQQAKALGFSLGEIAELLSLRTDAGAGAREIKKIAETKLADIEARIKLLQRMRKTLKKMVDECPGEGPKSKCPILEALDSGYLQYE